MLLSVGAEARGFPWWGWVLIILAIALIILLLYWWWRSRKKAGQPKAEAAAPTMVAPAAPAEEAAPAPDDLEVIEGIGPKIAELLREAGIVTFAQLAATDVSRLQEILEKAKLRLADPATWPEQAGLAAAGKWEELKALQAQLKGGRKA